MNRDSDKDPPQPPSRAFLETVQEITRIYRSLPPRPSLEEVEAATSTLDTVDNEEQAKLHEISKEELPQGVPEDLFSVLKELKKTMVLFQGHQQRKEALHLLELEKMFQTFGDLIQRASELVSGDAQKQKASLAEIEIIAEDGAVVTGDSLVMMKKEKEEEEAQKNDLEKGSSVKGLLSAG